MFPIVLRRPFPSPPFGIVDKNNKKTTNDGAHRPIAECGAVASRETDPKMASAYTLGVAGCVPIL